MIAAARFISCSLPAEAEAGRCEPAVGLPGSPETLKEASDRPINHLASPQARIRIKPKDTLLCFSEASPGQPHRTAGNKAGVGDGGNV